jgi:hypothetical protein
LPVLVLVVAAMPVVVEEECDINSTQPRLTINNKITHITHISSISSISSSTVVKRTTHRRQPPLSPVRRISVRWRCKRRQ